jgi:hypothetical protein
LARSRVFIHNDPDGVKERLQGLVDERLRQEKGADRAIRLEFPPSPVISGRMARRSVRHIAAEDLRRSGIGKVPEERALLRDFEKKLSVEQSVSGFMRDRRPDATFGGRGSVLVERSGHDDRLDSLRTELREAEDAIREILVYGGTPKRFSTNRSILTGPGVVGYKPTARSSSVQVFSTSWFV